MAAAKKDQVELQITPIRIMTTEITVVGDSPLIVHAWSEKAKRMMLEAQQGKKAVKAKEVRDPFNEFVNSLYWITPKPEFDGKTEDEEKALYEEAIKNGARFGFKVSAVKMAANSTAYRMGWVKNQMALKGSYFLNADYTVDGEEYAWIEADPPEFREDMVRIGMGTADLRYRGQFNNWKMHMRLSYNASGVIRLEQILSCLNAGGFSCGIGEWRPEKDGCFGRFHIETA